jgi:hypothetical protein
MFRPDRLVLQVSYPLAGLVIAVHVGVTAAALLSALPLMLKLLLLAVLVWQAVYLLRRYVLLTHPCAIREIRWTELSWYLRLADGAELEAHPSPGCRVYGWITLLRFKVISPAAGQSAHLNAWLLPGLGTEQAIRRMRVQLIHSFASRN